MRPLLPSLSDFYIKEKINAHVPGEQGILDTTASNAGLMSVTKALMSSVSPDVMRGDNTLYTSWK